MQNLTDPKERGRVIPPSNQRLTEANVTAFTEVNEDLRNAANQNFQEYYTAALLPILRAASK